MARYLVQTRVQIFAKGFMDFYLLLKIWVKILVKILVNT